MWSGPTQAAVALVPYRWIFPVSYMKFIWNHVNDPHIDWKMTRNESVIVYSVHNGPSAQTGYWCHDMVMKDTWRLRSTATHSKYLVELLTKARSRGRLSHDAKLTSSWRVNATEPHKHRLGVEVEGDTPVFRRLHSIVCDTKLAVFTRCLASNL